MCAVLKALFFLYLGPLRIGYIPGAFMRGAGWRFHVHPAGDFWRGWAWGLTVV